LQKTPRFLITDFQFPDITSERRIIENAGGDLVAFQCKTERDVIEVAGDADALLVQWAPITRTVIDHLPNCKVIVRYGIGLDNIDLDAARDRGIAVRNIPDYCIEEVADHTFSLALALARQLLQIDRQVREGTWSIVPPRPMPALRESTFVTIGHGRIARAVLHRARGFGFRLAACDPYLPPGVDFPSDVTRVDFEDALQVADILSLHVPLTRETRYIIEPQTLTMMKPTSLLINTARGALIDTMGLARALDEGVIAGAGLDVFEAEPLPAEHPLRTCRNALLTSHVSWYSQLSGPTLQRLAAEEAVRSLRQASPTLCM
jgi:D-3-phosphoglycerate dehydrogenase / 2-oxoglutarate reductase